MQRFYFTERDLTQHFYIHDAAIRQQLTRVLRVRQGEEVVLFDGRGQDRMYRIMAITPREIEVQLVTQLEPIKPPRHVVLFWSLLKKDKNEWVVQKATELGVSTLVPIISDLNSTPKCTTQPNNTPFSLATCNELV